MMTLNFTRPKPPGPAFARMVSELEPAETHESELTREIFRARLREANSDTPGHGQQTRTLLARLFPLDAHAPDIARNR